MAAAELRCDVGGPVQSCDFRRSWRADIEAYFVTSSWRRKPATLFGSSRSLETCRQSDT
ncbi:hypothetical protein ACP70R_005089 [Stipagrostis hirtigluma subsp. patula]